MKTKAVRLYGKADLRLEEFELPPMRDDEILARVVTEASGDGPLDAAEWQKWVDTMEQLRISYVCWSLSDKNETCSMLLPRAKSCGDWTDDLIKPWGKMARAAINKKP